MPTAALLTIFLQTATVWFIGIIGVRVEVLLKTNFNLLMTIFELSFPNFSEALWKRRCLY
jgi:hypothetical protein